MSNLSKIFESMDMRYGYSVATLADMTHIHEDIVVRCLRELQKGGLVEEVSGKWRRKEREYRTKQKQLI